MEQQDINFGKWMLQGRIDWDTLSASVVFAFPVDNKISSIVLSVQEARVLGQMLVFLADDGERQVELARYLEASGIFNRGSARTIVEGLEKWRMQSMVNEGGVTLTDDE